MKKPAIPEQKTDAKIDPEFAAKRTAQDTGKIVGISVSFLTVLAGALTYIYLYTRTL